MAAIRDVAAIAKKWATVTPQRAADYEAGIRTPKKDWKQSTLDANEAWKQGTTEAVAANRFAKGVNASSTANWQENAVTKGVQRWGPGVQLAENKYLKGFQPYADAIKNVTLPPRFPRRDPRNLLRGKAIVDAMVKTKEALLG